MKVKVIGSGSMWTKYNSACYLIDEDIMVDFPNGACKYLYRLNIKPNSINHILLTHFHRDHYGSIPKIIEKYNVKVLDKSIKIEGFALKMIASTYYCFSHLNAVT